MCDPVTATYVTQEQRLQVHNFDEYSSSKSIYENATTTS